MLLESLFHDVLLTIILKFENRSNAPLLTHLQQLLDFQGQRQVVVHSTGCGGDRHRVGARRRTLRRTGTPPAAAN